MQNNFGFLAFNDFEELDLVGPWEIIGIWSNQFHGPQNVFIVSESGGMIKGSKGLRIQSDYHFRNCPPLDFILVPGGMGTRSEVHNSVIIDFIQNQASNCQVILSVCTGAFLLQAAGLLTGKKATTHWLSLDRLRAFKDISVCEERYLKDGNIWTSAGVSAGIDMTLAFIADFTDSETAAEIQCYAEYFPENKHYFSKQQKNTLPKYVTKICK